MKSVPPQNVDDYLKSFTGKQKETLDKVRKVIRSTVPKAQESISYGIPAYKLDGKAVAYFAGFKNHCSYFPGSYAVMKQFEEELRAYEVSKGTIQFSTDQPLSSSLIRKMVQAKVKENELKLQANADQKSKAKKKATKTNQ